MSRDKNGRGFTTGRRQVLTSIDQRCSITGCEALAEGSVTIAGPKSERRYYGCVDHIDGMRQALAIAIQEVQGREVQ